MTDRPRVAVLIKTDSDWHRSLIRGIAQFADQDGGWAFTVPAADGSGQVFLPEDWEGEAVICRLTSERLLDQIKAAGVPAVNVSWLYDHLTLPKVVSDEAGCAKLASEVFINKQFENYGYIGCPPWAPYSDAIESTLRESIKPFSDTLAGFPLSEQPSANQGVDVERLATWLKSLPLPIGIVVWSSHVGCLAAQVCEEIGLDVPRDVAILCIEHDNLWSELATTPLSNLDQDPTRVGYLAAKQVRSMMDGEPAPKEPVLVPPISVVHRLSTEVTAVSDPILRLALQYIYEHAKDGCSVGELISILGVSRRSLEGKFKRNFTCSPAAFIRNLQLQEVARLLRSTTLSISEIAEKTGYEYVEVMMRAFKREFGITPMQFRESGGQRRVAAMKDRGFSKPNVIR